MGTRSYNHYLQVHFFLRFLDFVHFAVIKFCYFEYTMYTMSLYRITNNIILGLQASNREKANQYKFVQRSLLVVMVVSSKRPLIPAFFQPE